MILDSTKINWYTRHPARTIPWDDLVYGLERNILDGYIRKQNHPEFPLTIYTYTNECQYAQNWNVFTMMARGLILDHKHKTIVAAPFIKFFNWEELGITAYTAQLLSQKFETFLKIDGSLGVLYNYNYKWFVATKGSFGSPQALWATEYLNTHIGIKQLNPLYTYCVEIIYPENRIVVDYGGKKSLTLLTVFDNNGYELLTEMISNIANFHRFDEIETIDINEDLSRVLKKKQELSANEEGYVIRFYNGTRVKIKGEEYIKAHRAIFGMTPLSIWELMKDQQYNNNVFKDLPSDLHILKKSYEAIFANNYRIIHDKLLKAVEQYNQLSDKELGQNLHTIPDETVRSLIFAVRKEGFSKRVRDRIFEYFRPKNNNLVIL